MHNVYTLLTIMKDFKPLNKNMMLKIYSGMSKALLADKKSDKDSTNCFAAFHFASNDVNSITLSKMHLKS